MLKRKVCRRRVIGGGLLAAGAIVLHLVCAAPASAQSVCRGDINGDSQLTADDVTALTPLLFIPFEDLAPALAARADGNGDGDVTAADMTALIGREGLPCPPTPTRTATRTPTATPTPSATATPTPVCMVQSVMLGTTSGALTASDCLRSVNGAVRATKVYSFVGTPGTALKVDVVATSTPLPIVPVVMVIDSNGQFGTVVGDPPIELAVTTSRPYEIWVSTDPSGPALGAYNLTLTALTCATPVSLALPRSGVSLAADLTVAVATPTATPTFPSVVGGNLDGTECPDPGAPFGAGGTEPDNPADTYVFTVSQVPTNVSITMQQVFIDDDIFPEVTVIGPDGFEVVSADQNVDCTSFDTFLFCARVRFLALQAGTYTVIATGGGGTGRYTLQLGRPTCNPTALPTIPSDHPLSCPNAPPGTGCPGTLYGDTTRTSCAAPLPIPGISDDVPAPGSPANLYTFTASAGDVISVAMTAEDDAHLYLLGPATRGNPLITQDDNGGLFQGGTDAQLAATLPMDGTYTIIAANNHPLDPPDPSDPTDVGQTVGYALSIQKCGVAGSLNSVVGRPQSFSTLDCFGFGGLPLRTYVLNGTAGGFVSIRMSSTDVDAFVRLLAPDGSVVESDTDAFSPGTPDARVNRILPVDGAYFVEISTSPRQPGIDVIGSIPTFTLESTSCETQPGNPPAISGAFENTDCEATGGRKFDVYTFDGSNGPVPGVASVSPPNGGCVVALLAEGPQAPDGACATTTTDIPVLGSGTYGVIVAARDSATRGGYTVPLVRCPVDTLGYGDVRTSSLATGTCADTGGTGAQWYLFRALADVVRFNHALSGDLTAGVPLAAELSDRLGRFAVSGSFFDDPDALFPISADLAAVLKVAPATSCGAGGCAYTLRIDPALLRQLPSP